MKKYISVFLILLMISACVPQVTEIPVIPSAPVASQPTPLFTPTHASQQRSLTVCLGEEPNTLYPYGSLNSAARSVLSAIYDGPMDVVQYGYEPIILEKIPTMDDGDAQVSPVIVQAGDQVVDSSGNLAILNAGVEIRPSGCR
ncbi:MAG TPA: hypothetical protein VKE92_16475, partial [Anaerolineales bacterium]|nr:hypothetical protein [Anaerolineales bacterium]